MLDHSMQAMADRVEKALQGMPGVVSTGQEPEMGETYVYAIFDDGERERSIRVIVECPEDEGHSQGIPARKGSQRFDDVRVGQRINFKGDEWVRCPERVNRAGDILASNQLDYYGLTADTNLTYNVKGDLGVLFIYNAAYVEVL
jgi:hypothetical protein